MSYQPKIYVFLTTLTANILKTWDNQPEIQYIYHQLRKIPNIWDFSTYQPFYFTETEANPEYLGLDTNITAIFSNNTGYTLQLQASTQPTTP